LDAGQDIWTALKDKRQRLGVEFRRHRGGGWEYVGDEVRVLEKEYSGPESRKSTKVS
jgi:hypothetical protein